MGGNLETHKESSSRVQEGVKTTEFRRFRKRQPAASTLYKLLTQLHFSPLRHFTFHIETHKESSSRVQRGVKNSRVSQHRVSQLYLLTWAKLLPAQKQLTCNSSQIAHFTLRCRGVICGEFVASTRRSQNSRSFAAQSLAAYLVKATASSKNI